MFFYGCKPFSNFGCDLVVDPLIHGLNRENMIIESFVLLTHLLPHQNQISGLRLRHEEQRRLPRSSCLVVAKLRVPCIFGRANFGSCPTGKADVFNNPTLVVPGQRVMPPGIFAYTFWVHRILCKISNLKFQLDPGCLVTGFLVTSQTRILARMVNGQLSFQLADMEL
jgi:hypothetical protein